MNNTITEYFLSLIKIDSESKNEKAVAEKLGIKPIRKLVGM